MSEGTTLSGQGHSDYQELSPGGVEATCKPVRAEEAQPVWFPLRNLAAKIFSALSRPKQSEIATSLQGPAVIPRPVHWQGMPGHFFLTGETLMGARGPALSEAEKLADWLRASTGLNLSVIASPSSARAIILEQISALQSKLGTEGYRLSITPERVLIQAATPAGLFYGGITLRQLLPPQAFAAGRAPEDSMEWTVPCLEIEDFPRFGWRGLMLDVVRHYMPVEFVKKFIDLAALHKFNRLQLHLTDDQGWRIEIQRYPRLTQIGACRRESPRKGNRKRGDATPYGPYFYSQQEIRELVQYARDRHIILVPEIEMPGHFMAALAAYPELSCTGGPFQVRTSWGIEKEVLCPGNPRSIEFVTHVLEEVIDLFPSPYIHIGGDEAPRHRWRKCPKCQARMRAEGLRAEAQLQTSLNHQVGQFLAARGRRMLGWDEILEGGLTPDAIVMSWRGMRGGIAAARSGHDVVMAPTSHCYLDYAHSRFPGEPESIGGCISLNKIYAFEPVPSSLSEEKRKHILGAQGNIWTEFIWTPRDVEFFAFPRATALSEVLWSPARPRSFPDFSRRLQTHLTRLDALGVRYRGAKE